MQLGYFLISKDEDPEPIRTRMVIEGCAPKRVYWDRIEKMSDPRTGRNKVMKNLRRGDKLLIRNLFELCGRWKDILVWHEQLERKSVKLLVGIESKIHFEGESVELIEGFRNAHGKFQTKAGNRSRKNRAGKGVGAPKGPRDKEKALRALIMRDSKDSEGNPLYSVAEICNALGISKRTYYYSYIPYAESIINK